MTRRRISGNLRREKPRRASFRGGRSHRCLFGKARLFKAPENGESFLPGQKAFSVFRRFEKAGFTEKTAVGSTTSERCPARFLAAQVPADAAARHASSGSQVMTASGSNFRSIVWRALRFSTVSKMIEKS